MLYRWKMLVFWVNGHVRRIGRVEVSNCFFPSKMTFSCKNKRLPITRSIWFKRLAHVISRIHLYLIVQPIHSFLLHQPPKPSSKTVVLLRTTTQHTPSNSSQPQYSNLHHHKPNQPTHHGPCRRTIHLQMRPGLLSIRASRR